MNALRNVVEVFFVFLRLGLTSFGGPVAHFGYFHSEFVVRRKWLDENLFASIISLCQFLPGPASSQMGMAIGFFRAGILGSMAAWLGFTLPSAVILVLFGFWFSCFPGDVGGWVHGFKIVTVAIVAQAVIRMGESLCQDLWRRLTAIVSTALLLLLPSFSAQMSVMGFGALAGLAFCKHLEPAHYSCAYGFSKKWGLFFLLIFAGLLCFLPIAAAVGGHAVLKLADTFFRSGALVFGGGHVVLPVLQSQIVSQGWVTNDVFLTGYSVAQAVPGPLFSFAAFLGSVSHGHPSGWIGATVALVSIFLPGYLLVIGILPFWGSLFRWKYIGPIMAGVNASVVGILLAALVTPVMSTAIHTYGDFLAAAGCYIILCRWGNLRWTVVVLLAGVGLLFHYLR
ncbi:MAG: chromate efflux transporter [Candidatus Omnitrophica bacterium]|nr:chromate efflux transporter [Candidatus Omnitrophota bacterium]